MLTQIVLQATGSRAARLLLLALFLGIPAAADRARAEPSPSNAVSVTRGEATDGNRPTGNVAVIRFADLRSAARGLADDRFEAYAKSMQGKAVTGEGWISKVEAGLDGGTACSVDMDDPAEATSPRDVVLDLVQAAPGTFKVGVKTRFSGRIRDLVRTDEGVQVTIIDVRF